MLKVNLLKNKGGSGQQEPTFAGNETIQFSVEDSSGNSDVVAKIIAMLVWVVLLYGYEWYNVSQLTARANAAKAQLNKVNNDIQNLKPQIDAAKAITREYEAFKKKIELVKVIGQNRLREIRALDHLQNVIPEKSWFTLVKFENDQFQLEGVAANDQTLDTLLASVRRHSGFKDVLLSKAVESKNDQGTLKVFVINSNMTGGGQQ